MAIQGLRDTSNFVANQRPETWRDNMLLLYPNGRLSLTALTSLMKKNTLTDPKTHWWERELISRRVTLSADITGVSSNMPVLADARTLKNGDILYSEQTTERMLVTQDPSSDTGIVVQRGFMSTTPTAITYDGAGINPNLLCIGNVYEEGSLAPTGIALDPEEKWNQTQIFRDSLEASRTAKKTKLRTKNAVAQAKADTLEIHGLAIEWALWFGKKSTGTKNGKPFRTMDGVLEFIPAANTKDVLTDYAGGLTMEGLEEYMYNIFRYGSSEKLGFCGNRALLTIQQVMRKNAAWQFMSGIKEFGMNVSRLISPFGEIVLKTHPLWNQNTGGVTGGTAYYGMESWLVALDAENLVWAPFEGDDTRYEPDVGEKGLDGVKSAFLTEATIEVHQPKTHYVLKRLHAAAADS